MSAEARNIVNDVGELYVSAEARNIVNDVGELYVSDVGEERRQHQLLIELTTLIGDSSLCAE